MHLRLFCRPDGEPAAIFRARNLLGPAAHDDGRIALEDLSSERRAESNIDDDELALEATHVGEYGEHAHAKRQGFRKGDVIVSIAGKSIECANPIYLRFW